jgi:hypothetical protein
MEFPGVSMGGEGFGRPNQNRHDNEILNTSFIS